MIRSFILLSMMLFLNGPLAFAQSDPTPTPTEAEAESSKSHEKVLVNSKLNTRMQEVLKNTLQVDREADGIAFLVLKGQSYTENTQIIFFRKKGTRLQNIATGNVGTEQVNASTGKRELLVIIDKSTIVKYPQSGDIAVPLADPTAKGEGDKKDEHNLPAPEEKAVEGDRYEGYLEIQLGLLKGAYTQEYQAPSQAVPSPTPLPANRAKNSSGYRFSSLHFAYYSGFFPIGLEYDSHSGSFPTGNDFVLHTTYTSKESVSHFSLNYRFPKWFHWIEFTPRIVSLSDDFTTTNTDEGLLNSKISGLGFGGRLSIEPVSPTWKKKKGEWPIQLQSLFAEYTAYPSISEHDGAVSRGTSTGSSGKEYRLGGSLMFWFDFIPFFKRWILTGSYGVRSYQLKFSGPPVYGSNSFAIPAGSGSLEAEKDYRLYLGFRIEDPIAILLGSKKDSATEKGK